MGQLRKINFLLLILTLAVSLFACNPEEENPLQINKKVKEAIFESMQEWYYWNDELPATINVNQFNSNDELLFSLMYRQLDRWSYLTTREAFNKSFTGQNAGHGFGFGIGPDDGLYISFVYENSPAGKDNWKRGWEIIEVNGKPISSYKVGNGYNFQLGPNEPGISNSFTFKLPDGSTTTRTNTKAEYQSNSVLHKEVIDTGQKKIGYWVYNSFKATSGISPAKSVEVDDALAFFEEQGINELIMDLRYNGGGSVNVAEQIMNQLIPQGNSGKDRCSVLHTVLHSL
jgi:C-terminal processing protease CtpA/Prc